MLNQFAAVASACCRSLVIRPLTGARLVPVVATALLAGGPAVAAGGADSDTDLVRTYCAGCHREATPGHFDRITNIRKSPEGWVMTLFRMRQVHGLALPEEVRDALVRHLADTLGLAPSESAAGRFALERRPNVQDLQPGGDLQDLPVMCGRCHSIARVSLQRRDADEWLRLVHMHVGQWPTLEYQASARDRYWWQTATTELPGKLAEMYPFDTPAWREWQGRSRADLDGQWLVHGHTPGRGDYDGMATITRRGPGEYTASYALSYADGTPVVGSSKAVLYTGYEWRGTAELDGEPVREILASSDDGAQLKGRWFLQDHAEVGGDWVAVRARGAPEILAVSPGAFRIGATVRATVFGRKLDGPVSFGPGTSTRVVARDANRITVDVTVGPGAKPGNRTVAVGKIRAADPVAVYDRIDRVEVEPGYGIGRVGGGKIAPVSAQFEAVGYFDVPVDDAGTKNAIRLGVLPAAWSVAPYDAQAKQNDDTRFAGGIDETGRFTPGAAGPNPERGFSGNNVGNLLVIATVPDGDRQVTGSAHLIVTVQRWNTPPIY